MATLIPALGSCVSRMTAGERRTAERLEQKLDPDYLLWYDVAVGPKHQHPDFVVMHPRRGILILEVKDFRLSTLIQANKQTWDIHGDNGPKTIANPLEQARQYAHQVAHALERDPQLVHPDGRHQGKLAFPWSYGVVLPNITRAQFDKAELAHAIEPHRVICQDEMGEHVDPEALQSRLWDMFPFMMGGVMSLPQMERVRWIMFPEVRVAVPGTLSLFDDSDEAAELPSIMRVMDIQQEQLARSLGEGHRVIHGVAGSGKTMLLGYRAEHLAKAQTAASKSILILCYNEPLARQIARVMAAKGIADHLPQAHQEGFARGDMAVLCADTKTRDLCARTLAQRKLRVENRIGTGHFDPASNKIKVMTMKVSKGLEFPVVALPGVGHMPAGGRTRRTRRECSMWWRLERRRGW
jgi:Nuclease-related domain